MEKERKLQIIKTAVKRFSKHGLGKTTLDEIARDLRIGKATIYHYFESKDDLYYQCIAWETRQFIEEIKSIFNNESLEVKDRFLEYFKCKEEVDHKYKMLYELVLLLLRDPSFEKEAEIFNNFIKQEEEVLRLFVGSIYTSRIETMNPSIPSFISSQSWGFLFASKINYVSGTEKIANAKELFYKTLDTILA